MNKYRVQQGNNGPEIRGLPCEFCGSSDAVIFRIHDNYTFCFSGACGRATNNRYSKYEDILTAYQRKYGDMEDIESGKDATVTDISTKQEEQGTIIQSVFVPIHSRMLLKETCEKYGVRCDVNNETGKIVKVRFPYYDFDGTQVATKYKIYPSTPGEKKRYWSEGKIDDAVLFGMTKFQSGWKTVTISEGEEDAMAAHQMLGVQAPVVSLKNGAQSAKSVFTNVQVYDWMNSFEKIVISFDNDEAGKAATNELTEIFSPEKVHVMKMRYKDANDYLMKGKTEEFIKDWRAAKPEILEGIKNLKDSVNFALVPANVEKIKYPWVELDSMTRGIRLGEVSTFLSGTGLGKSTLMGELLWHILKETDSNIGCLFLENSERETVQNIVGLAMSYPLKFALENDEEFEQAVFNYDAKHNQEGKFLEDRNKAVALTVGSGRLWTLSDMDYNVNNIEKILSRVRYFAKVLGCKYIFLDHISLIVSGGEHDGDERKALDEISTKLAMIVKELGIHLFMVSQCSTPKGKALEEGGATSLNMVRGTRGIGHISHNVYGIERNNQDEDPVIRNTTLIRVLKCRWTGRTGPSSFLLYDGATGRLTETANPELSEVKTEVKEEDVVVMDLGRFSGLNERAANV